MADRIPAGVDPAGLRDIVGNQINPATVESIEALGDLLGQAGIVIPVSDSVYATYPSDETEVYTYKLSGVTVAVITVTFTDYTKETLVSVVKV